MVGASMRLTLATLASKQIDKNAKSVGNDIPHAFGILNNYFFAIAFHNFFNAL